MLLTTESDEILVTEEGAYLVTEDYEGVFIDVSTVTEMILSTASEVRVQPLRATPIPGYDVPIQKRAFDGGLPFTLDRFGRPT